MAERGHVAALFNIRIAAGTGVARVALLFTGRLDLRGEVIVDVLQLRDLGVLPLAAGLADAVLQAIRLIGLLLVNDPVAPVVAERRLAHELDILAAAADIILRARLCAVRLSALIRLKLVVMPQLRKDLRIGVAAARAVVFLQAGRGARRLDDRGDAAVAAVIMAERRGLAALNDIGFSARQARTVDTAKLGISLLGAGRLDNVLYRGVLVVGARDGIRLHLTAACAGVVLDAVGARGGLEIDLPIAPAVAECRRFLLIPVAALRAHVAHIARLRARSIVPGGDQLVAGRGQHDTVCRAAVLAHGDDGAVHRAGGLGARRLPRVFVEIDEVNMEARVRARDLRVIVLQRRRGQDIGDLIAVVITDRQIFKDRYAILGGGRAVRNDGSVAVAA